MVGAVDCSGCSGLGGLQGFYCFAEAMRQDGVKLVNSKGFYVA